MPATVQALLAARIDRLPPEPTRLLQTAALIGPAAPWALLQAIADTPHEALSATLDHPPAAAFASSVVNTPNSAIISPKIGEAEVWIL